MSTSKRLHYTYAEYLSTLEMSPVKLEYCDGIIYAMAGGTIQHAELAARMIGILQRVLGPRCRVFTSDLKVRVESSDLSTFPDVSVVCGPFVASKIDAHAATNPTLLVEVTSKSTEDYDRGDKLSHYKQLASLRAVLFVSHRTKAITIVERTATGWAEREIRAGERVAIATPECVFGVDEIYDGIELETA